MNNRLRKSDNMTMNDIASELGLSKTTVSRAISGKGRIGKETRDRILGCIREKGYEPNQVARALAVSRTYNIGVAIPDEKSGGDAQFFSDCLVGVTKAAVSRDYDTFLVVVSDDDMAGLERIVRNRKADGIIVTRMSTQDGIIPYLQKSELPFILIGTDENSDILQIDTNQKEGCRELTMHLISSGCRKIALMAGCKSRPVDFMRYNGYKDAFVEAGIEFDESLVWWNAADSCSESVKQALDAGADGIACTDDMICSAVLECLSAENVRIPEDVQVVSFYDSEEIASCQVPVTALHIDSFDLCMRAGNLLIDEIEGCRPERKNTAEYSVIYRNSSRRG
jgi:DNA-binding LacI/PurR family transcriptional regulator